MNKQFEVQYTRHNGDIAKQTYYVDSAEAAKEAFLRCVFGRDESHILAVVETTPPAPARRQSFSRTSSKMESVILVMNDGLFRTLPEISQLAGYESLTGLSACIRSLRKAENGAYTVDKRKREDSNECEYKLSS